MLGRLGIATQVNWIPLNLIADIEIEHASARDTS